MGQPAQPLLGADKAEPPINRVFFLSALLATGMGAGAWFVGSPGPGLFVVLVAMTGATAVVVAGGFVFDRWSVAFGAEAFGLVLVAVLRAAEWLVVPSLLIALGLAALAVGGGSTWRELMDSLMAPLLRLPAAPDFLRRALRPSAKGLRTPKGPQLVRGLMMAAFLVFVFGALFSSADPVFRRILSRLVADWDPGVLPARGLMGLLALAATSGFVLAGRLGRRKAAESLFDWAGRSVVWRAGRIEWLTALGALNLLFAVFVGVQVTVLFGGRDYVMRTAGLTYAAYARQGYGQLVIVAVLTLAVVAFAWTWSARDQNNEEVVFRILLGVVCVLTLVVVASALQRLRLYEEAFGFSRLRMAAHGSIIWLAAVLMTVLASGATRRADWLPRALAAMTGAAVVFFALANPDALVARRNIERYAATGKIDLQYLASLSPDAVPQLIRLEPFARAKALERIAGYLSEPEPWSSANLSRIRARKLLEGDGD